MSVARMQVLRFQKKMGKSHYKGFWQETQELLDNCGENL